MLPTSFADEFFCRTPWLPPKLLHDVRVGLEQRLDRVTHLLGDLGGVYTFSEEERRIAMPKVLRARVLDPD
jgi:hypothetical protein